MDTLETTMAREIAQVAGASQHQRTGYAPASVTVVLSEDTVVVTLHEALSPAEKVLARSAAGAAQVQEFHRQLFAGSSDALRYEVARIIGRRVQEVAAEVEPATGTVIHAFTTGTMVQIFHLAKRLPDEVPGEAVPPIHIGHDPANAAGTKPLHTDQDPLPTIAQLWAFPIHL